MSALKSALAGPVVRAAVLALPLLLAACGSKDDAAKGAPAGGMPPTEVGVVTTQTQPVGLTTELPGRLEASRVAQVRARAAGILQKRLFVEGSRVKAGQLLYQIDAAPYQAALASAKAQVTRAQANLAQASAQAERYKPLLAANAVSKQDYTNAVAAQKQAEADVAAGRAAVQTAQINLGYASVTAPISGHIGRSLVTEGALVGQGEATPLALIQQVDPLYVNFTQPSATVLQLRRSVADGRMQAATGIAAARVHIVLEDGTVYDQPGKLLFSDLSVDPTSGQIMLRAEVPNPQNLLLPGMYVRVRLEQAKLSDGILVPQQAVQRGATGDSVMVVGSDGKVTPRPVKVGSAQGDRWVILEGLQPGEQVMVDGFQKLRANAPVKAVPWHAPGASGPTGAASAAAPRAHAGAVGAASAASAPSKVAGVAAAASGR